MQNTGVVKTVDGEYASVSFSRQSACGGDCASCGLCKSKEHIAKVINRAGALPGDVVTVETPDGRIFLAAFLVYIFPMITALTVGALMYSGGVSGLYSTLTAAAVMAVIYFLLSNKLAQKSRYFMGHITTVSYRQPSKNVIK
jgi:positive regulator of sigma E activity